MNNKKKKRLYLTLDCNLYNQLVERSKRDVQRLDGVVLSHKAICLREREVFLVLRHGDSDGPITPASTIRCAMARIEARSSPSRAITAQVAWTTSSRRLSAGVALGWALMMFPYTGLAPHNKCYAALDNITTVVMLS